MQLQTHDRHVVSAMESLLTEGDKKKVKEAFSVLLDLSKNESSSTGSSVETGRGSGAGPSREDLH